MIVCDHLALSKIMKNLTYDDLVVSSGITSMFCETMYANKKISVLYSRWDVSYHSTLDDLGIGYCEVSVAEFFNMESFKDVLILIPKSFIEMADKIKEEAVQFNLIYSGFRVESISEKYIDLSLPLTHKINRPLRISKKVFIKLSRLHVRPLGYPFKIYRVTDVNQQFNKKVIINSVSKKLLKCLDDYQSTQNNMLATVGVGSYDKFAEFIMEWNNKESIVRKIFLNSLHGGSTTAFRKEFFKSLSKHEILGGKAPNEHVKLSNMWESVVKNLNTRNLANVSSLAQEVLNIKNIETNLIEDILSKL